MAKAKPTKHTSAELQAKAKAALANKGGGKAGLADRKGGKVGHAKYKCFVCSIQARPAYNTLSHETFVFSLRALTLVDQTNCRAICLSAHPNGVLINSTFTCERLH
jgi:hypothetical protein